MGTWWLVSGSIWIISAPLVMDAFNVISPAGLLINVLLIPLVGFGLCFGFASVLLGIVSETMAVPFAVAFGWVLQLVVLIVEFVASIDAGHAWVPGPLRGWLIVFYGAVALAMVATTLRRRPGLAWSCVGVWIIFGLTLAPANRKEGSLRCTFLYVGHGLSVLVETPAGRTLLYDVGSRGGGEYSSMVVKEALWKRGVSKIDAVIVSHSDIDHYNGVIDLIHSVPVARIFCSRHFPDQKQPLTLLMFEQATSAGIVPEIVTRGDRIDLDEEVSVRILQPVAKETYDSDNAASVVVEIEYRNRRILLTGDLDEDGLLELLNQPSRDIDVLLAPHHGEPDANPPALAAWSTPEWVIVSAPSDDYRSELEEHYATGTRIIMTSESGAITAVITSDGTLHVNSFLKQVR